MPTAIAMRCSACSGWRPISRNASLHLGYRTATLLAPIPGHAAGSALRGHEFHYARVVAQPDEPLAEIRDASGVATAETGSRRGHVSGSFFHMVDVAGGEPAMTASD